MLSLSLRAAGIGVFSILIPILIPATGQATQINFKGHSFVIGSAAEKARAIQRVTGPDVVYWPARGALFVADPSLDGVMVYDETKAGTTVRPYGILSGPNTLLDGPVALATGTDFPCATTCTPYLWVANAGSQTITYYTLPLTSWNQAPVATISWNGNPMCNGYSQVTGSTSPLQFPYGIAHFWYPSVPYGNPIGQIVQTSEADVGNNYWINSWNATDVGPTQCTAAYTSSGELVSPSGPSAYIQYNQVGDVFNANSTTVTLNFFDGNHFGWLGPLVGEWNLGACTEGTAVEAGSSPSNSYVWVTSSAGCKYPKSDAIWSCNIGSFGYTGCPSVPVCKNPQARLDFPDLPGFSALTNRLYVPNQNNGTVTAYTLNGSGSATGRPKSVYLNTQTPIGVALQY
jgi:hypothetical protein